MKGHRLMVTRRERSVHDLEEAIRLAESEFAVHHLVRELAHVRLHEDRPLICWNGSWHRLTEMALKNLLGSVGVPLSFAKRMPWDLVVYVFERLKQTGTTRRLRLALRGVDEAVVNVFPDREERLFRSADVLKGLATVLHALAPLEVHKVHLSDLGFAVDLLGPNLVLRPIPGDITRVGVRISGSETLPTPLTACAFLHRLRCSNGMVVREKSLTLRPDPNAPSAHVLEEFFGSLGELVGRISREAMLAHAYARLREQRISARELLALHARLRRVIPVREADGLLGLTAQARKALASGAWEPLGTRWDVLNAITEAAQRFDLVRRMQLEEIGGSLITA